MGLLPCYALLIWAWYWARLLDLSAPPPKPAILSTKDAAILQPLSPNPKPSRRGSTRTLVQPEMDPALGELVDDHEEVDRAAARANRRAHALERRRRLAARIMAERNANDVKQFNEAFPEGTHITDDLIIWWARDRASFHRFQVTRTRWTRMLAAFEGRED